MDLLIICKDALETSFIGSLVVAMEAKKQGREVGVVFTAEALLPLVGNAFDWPPLLKNRATRVTLTRNAKNMGIPVVSARDARETDTWQLMKAAKQSGVSLIACPTWASLLGLKGKLPPEITEIDTVAFMETLLKAGRVIGSL